MRILVTGCTGFAGGHLVDALLEQGGAELHGISRTGRWPDSLRHLTGQVALRPLDLADRVGLNALLREVQPDAIYHLAGYPHVGRSDQEADQARADNLTATENLYDSIIAWGGRPRILYVSSSLVYGEGQNAGERIDENCVLNPLNPYAASKAAADLASLQNAQERGLAIVRARPFTHIGPRQAPEFSVSRFARQIADIEAGRQTVLIHGNLTSHRDFTDVRDIVRAYILLMERGEVGEAYNVGSGVAQLLQSVLDQLLSLARVQVKTELDPKLVRKADTAVLRANADKLHRLTGWQPRFSLEQTLLDTLEYWRKSQ